MEGTASTRNETDLTYILENSVEFFNEGNGWTGPPISLILLITIMSQASFALLKMKTNWRTTKNMASQELCLLTDF